MAYISPSRKDMPYFKEYLAKSSSNGKIDTRALGEFIIEQSKNNNVDMQYKHTKNGDYFEVFEVENPNNVIVVPCEKRDFDIDKEKGVLNKIKNFFGVGKSYEFDPQGSWDNLPKPMKEAGRIADNMEKDVS